MISHFLICSGLLEFYNLNWFFCEALVKLFDINYLMLVFVVFQIWQPLLKTC